MDLYRVSITYIPSDRECVGVFEAYDIHEAVDAALQYYALVFRCDERYLVINEIITLTNGKR